MFLALKEIYKEKCIIDEIPEHPNDFYWFKDLDNHLIGMSKDILPSEKRLISIMFDEIVAIDFDQHTRLLWLNLFLFGKTKILDQLPKKHKQIKLIFFNHTFDSEVKLEFDALIKQFDEQFMALFIDSQYGVILDFTEDAHYSMQELEDFVDALQQDFYCSMTFYQTGSYPLDETLKENFRVEFELYKSFYNTDCLVMEKQDLLLQFLIDKLNEKHFEKLKQQIKNTPDDQLEVVKCYLENNFNLSFGAKILHMHRNTFMKKIEKFGQETGLNVKEFRDAVLAYLLIENIESR